MMIFGRNHSHIKVETLSEYLDGRLPGPAAARVDRQLTACASCRRDLEGLRSTVSLLRHLPEVTLPRSFTLAGPPVEQVAARPPLPLRVPQWVYAGAASATAVVLAILVSADASGLLAPSAVPVAQELAAVAPPEPERGFQERLSPTTAMERVEPPPVVESLAAQAPAPRATPLAASPAPPPAPEALTAGREFAIEAPAEAVAAATAEERPALEQELAPAGTVEETPAPVQLEDAQPPIREAEYRDLSAAASQGTSVTWRVLEGLAAAVGLAFLAALILKRRASRRTIRG